MSRISTKVKKVLSKKLAPDFFTEGIKIILYKDAVQDDDEIYSYYAKVPYKIATLRGYIDIGKDNAEYHYKGSQTVERCLALFLSDDLKFADLWNYELNRSIINVGDEIEHNGIRYKIRATDDKTPLIGKESIISEFEFFKEGLNEDA